MFAMDGVDKTVPIGFESGKFNGVVAVNADERKLAEMKVAMLHDHGACMCFSDAPTKCTRCHHAACS